MGTKKVNARLRVRFVHATKKWQAVALDRFDKVIDESPEGTEVEAEGYMVNYRRTGAWLAS